MDPEPGASPIGDQASVVGRFDAQRTCLPKLGDFTKLQLLASPRLETLAQALKGDASLNLTGGAGKHPLGTSAVEQCPSASLGDFFRLFSQLQTQLAVSRVSKQGYSVRTVSGQAWEPCQRSHALETDLSADSDHDVSLHFGHVSESDVTPSTTPPALWDFHAPPFTNSAYQHEDLSGPSAESGRTQKRRPDVGRVLSYQLYKNGSLISVLDKRRTREQKCASLSLSLVPLRAWDKFRAAQSPDVGTNGVHVFLDMSNINISFQQTLRAKYSIDASARFTPLPSLDLGFLSEVLVRGRRVVALNAGCSVLPGKPAPRFLKELRDRGYHVDLRERKRVVAGPARLSRRRAGAGVSSSDEMSAGVGTVRHVEDLVDETLQTRIAESVMEYFRAQGTLVIATGDAQPAKYSDGFFTYAERALKMGWNVEVVSWRGSLSSYWRSSEWTGRWGNRFRIIELDEFVDDLLACHV
ncbi:hypothetical protein OCS_06744 [Ophiocordyceps sinensis CO18]|uniref:Cell wall glucanase n=1 Tax=Ophiocordyceps sinensis (strain Co18 / CGMCC 3.14243) TaxID=911162 RepID=T5A4N0_OPHSC|nr:hypothetical protein OCS_06744 [Ophiocordyceps sinensis CO18]